ncbi:MAG: phosphotransferase [Lachnospiraceae bacterium]|nr:phosphotransferase [Lachnospiraceae bacterium]
MKEQQPLMITLPSFEEEKKRKQQEEEQRQADTLLLSKNAQAVDQQLAQSLIDDKKTFGNSRLMKELKRNLEETEKALDTAWDGELTEEKITEIQSAIFKTIECCDRYCEERHSTRSTGMRRRELVEQNRSRLISELELLDTAKELLLKDRIETDDTKDLTVRDLLIRVRIYDFASAPEEKTAKVKEKTSQTKDKNLLEAIRTFRPNNAVITDKAEAEQYANEIMMLRRELKEFEEGKAYSTYINLHGNRFLIRQDEEGTVTLSNGESSVVMTESIADLISQLDFKMIEETEKMNPEAMIEVINDQHAQGTVIRELDIRGGAKIYSESVMKGVGEVQAVTTRLARFLEIKTQKPATFFSNLNMTELRQLAIAAARGEDLEEVIKYLLKLESERKGAYVNTQQTLELLRQSELRPGELREKVSYEIEEERTDEEILAGWTREEKEVRDFASELIFSQHTWEADATVSEPGKRILRIMESNTSAIAAIIADSYREDQTSPSLLDKMLDKIPLLTEKEKDAEGKEIEGQTDLKAELREEIELLRSRIDKMIEGQLEEQAEKIASQFMTDEMKEATKRRRDLLAIQDKGEITAVQKRELSLIERQRKPYLKYLEPIILSLKQDKEAVRIAVEMALRNRQYIGLDMSEFAKMDERISQSVDSASKGLQESITACVSKVFSREEEGEEEKKDKKEEKKQPPNRFAGLKDPKEKGISREVRKQREKEGLDALTETIRDCMQGESGQGKFIKLIFEHYFSGANLFDRRAMFASAMRNAVPQKTVPLPPSPPETLPENATEEEKKAYEEKKAEYEKKKKEYEDKKREAEEESMGNLLGGILKGAGPLFQKILQGLPVDGMPDCMKEALEDVKSKLAPIPEEIVKAQLLGMVERSHGKITKIEVEKALGAASVGQTFLCKMYGPDMPETGKDVVIKLLKPDVRNRMMREREIMLECARMTDEKGGMEATYLGQLARIEEELDLTIEARNVLIGEVYDKSSLKDKERDGVSSMKLVDGVEATANSMLLEKAPGDTVDRYSKAVAKKIEEYRKQLAKKEGETPEAYSIRVQTLREAILKDLKEVNIRQGYLAILSKKWATEGIFGEGFYHGDLHAGNIMIDDNGATVIDFGNATSLDDTQRINVTRMVAAAAVGDSSGFLEGLYNLLKPKFQQDFKAAHSRIAKMMKPIFSCGGKTAAGQRIAVALLKIQEEGIEVPSAIFNFSQCQLRLQNTVDGMDGQIGQLVQLLQDIDHTRTQLDSVQVDIDALYLSDMALANKDKEKDKEKTKEQEKETKEEAVNRYYQNLLTLHQKLDVENVDCYDLALETTDFAKERTKKFRDLDVENAYGNIMLQLKTAIDSVRTGNPFDLKGFISEDGWEDDIKRHFGIVVDTHELQRGIAARLKALKEEVGKTEGKNEELIRELGGTESEPPEWFRQVEAYLKEKRDIVATLVKRADEYMAIRDDASKSKEEKDKARDAFKEAYMPVRLAYIVTDLEAAGGGSMTKEQERFSMLSYNIAKAKDLSPLDRAVKRMAKEDKELGPVLLESYNEFLAVKKKIVDDPTSEIMEWQNSQIAEIEKVEGLTKKEKDKRINEIAGEAGLKRRQIETMARFDITFQKEKLMMLVTRIAARKVGSAYDSITEAYVNHSKTFVDVMGDAINDHLKEAFARLGPVTSFIYQRKL